MLIRNVLVASRGATAVRIMQTAKRLGGMRCVAVFSAAEPRALHVQRADDRVAIGGPLAADSYHNPQHLLQAAQSSGADAVHPGGQKLAASAAFADAVRRAGLNFIGPAPELLARLAAPDACAAAAHSVGLSYAPDAAGPFVDVQLAGDASGEVRCLGEVRSLWAPGGRAQIYAAPAPPAAAAPLRRLARQLGAALALQGLCVARFALPAQAAPQLVGLLPRLHPACAALEAAAGIDLVEWQFRLAMGERLPAPAPAPRAPPFVLQAQVRVQGDAVRLGTLVAPPAELCRVELASLGDSPLCLLYGTLLARLVVQGPSLAAARQALAQACAAFAVAGARTNLGALRRWAQAPQSGRDLSV